MAQSNLKDRSPEEAQTINGLFTALGVIASSLYSAKPHIETLLHLNPEEPILKAFAALVAGFIEAEPHVDESAKNLNLTVLAPAIISTDTASAIN